MKKIGAVKGEPEPQFPHVCEQLPGSLQNLGRIQIAEAARHGDARHHGFVNGGDLPDRSVIHAVREPLAFWRAEVHGQLVR